MSSASRSRDPRPTHWIVATCSLRFASGPLATHVRSIPVRMTRNRLKDATHSLTRGRLESPGFRFRRPPVECRGAAARFGRIPKKAFHGWWIHPIVATHQAKS